MQNHRNITGDDATSTPDDSDIKNLILVLIMEFFSHGFTYMRDNTLSMPCSSPALAKSFHSGVTSVFS
jgi:hypothetical protein